jgi:hypothetical protein
VLGVERYGLVVVAKKATEYVTRSTLAALFRGVYGLSRSVVHRRRASAWWAGRDALSAQWHRQRAAQVSAVDVVQVRLGGAGELVTVRVKELRPVPSGLPVCRSAVVSVNRPVMVSPCRVQVPAPSLSLVC